MEMVDPLSRHFIKQHPVEAARVLEQLPAADVAALISEIEADDVIELIIALLPAFAADCICALKTKTAVRLFNVLPVHTAARLFALLGKEKQDEVLALLSRKHGRRILNVLNYRALSAGDLMETSVHMMTDNLTAADAIRRIENLKQSAKCELYVVDAAHRFLGVVELGKLITARSQVRLRDIMQHSIRTVSVHASSESLLNNSVWAGHQYLPVVDSNQILVGTLAYERVRKTVEAENVSAPDPMESLYSLAGLYWVTMAQLIEGLLNLAVVKKGEKR